MWEAYTQIGRPVTGRVMGHDFVEGQLWVLIDLWGSDTASVPSL